MVASGNRTLVQGTMIEAQTACRVHAGVGHLAHTTLSVTNMQEHCMNVQVPAAGAYLQEPCTLEILTAL